MRELWDTATEQLTLHKRQGGGAVNEPFTALVLYYKYTYLGVWGPSEGPWGQYKASKCVT